MKIQHSTKYLLENLKAKFPAHKYVGLRFHDRTAAFRYDWLSIKTQFTKLSQNGMEMKKFKPCLIFNYFQEILGSQRVFSYLKFKPENNEVKIL